MALRNANRIVVKIGTSTLAHPSGNLNMHRMSRIIEVLSDLKNAGKEIVIVTSGAIGAGTARLKLGQRPKDTPMKQAAAAVGQCELMYLYDKFFMEYGYLTAQILMTRIITDRDNTRMNLINTFNALLTLGAVPIVNENDSVATEEIRNDDISFGENDTLSAVVATLINADMLILLSDIEGLYDRDPRKHHDARLIPYVNEISEEIRSVAGGAGSKIGTGGMETKLNAAQLVMTEGIDMVIMDGSKPDNLYRLLDGEPVGTFFKGKSTQTD